MSSLFLTSTGARYGHFVVDRSQEISELQITLVELTHEPTGAQVMHLVADDDENLFNLSFRTWPDSSNGVAHILEHTVLCGSEKFPVRDPFFGMSRRSLNTFMNAFTGADFTCYPASSQVPKDFYNLLEVYLDAVFHPRLLKKSFLQEGHRLEFAEPEDPSSPLTFKGIVFNEMKGALASGEARLGEALMHALFPDLTYGVNSGGDPKVIPSLTYDELKAFHAKFYHPSQCLFFFYGNLPLEGHLHFLEEHLLKDVKKEPPLPPLPQQKRLKKPVHHLLHYPIAAHEESQEKTFVGIGWLTCPILDQETVLALHVIDLVLMGTDAAPLKLALLKSGLCKQADSVIDSEISEIPFTLVCKGCEVENAEALEETIYQTLERIAEEGLPSHLVEGAIHQLELARSEITGNTHPYGLSLYFRSALLKQHGANPEEGLRIHTLFERLRKRVEDPFYLSSIIRKTLLNNTHSVRIVMAPDPELGKKENEEEEETLKQIRAALKKTEVTALVKEAKELTAYQEERDPIDVLPRVTLADVSSTGKEFPLKEERFGKLSLFHYPSFTNDIVYTALVYDLPHIEENDLSYLRLFTLLLPQLGCGGRTYIENLDYTLQHTGGIGLSLDLCLQADNPHQMRPSLSIGGKALLRKIDKFFPLMRDLLTSADFSDVERIRELLMQHFHGLESTIHHRALRYAVNLAARGLSVPSQILNRWYGLDYFWAVKEVVSSFENDPEPLIEKMKALKESCLSAEGGDLVLSCDEKSFEELKRREFFGLAEIPEKKMPSWKGDYQVTPTPSQGRLTSSPVAFTATLFPSVPYTHPHAAALSIVSEMMENKTLHKRVREQGGAYGTGAVNGVLSGQFYFYSYRDPHLHATLKAFREAVQEMVEGHFTERDIEEAKLGLLQDLDSPIAPGTRAHVAYGRLRGGRSPQVRQRFREALLQADKQILKQAAKDHLVPGLEKGITISFAGKELLEKENLLLKEKALPLYPI